MSSTTTRWERRRPASMQVHMNVLPTWVRLVRESDPAQSEPVWIRGPHDVHALLHDRATRELGEVFYLITLNTQSRVVGLHEVTRGVLRSTPVHPREVFIRAIGDYAAGVIVAHNHPSGDPTPSSDDKAVTRQLVDAGRLLDIPVYDHVVIGDGRYYSFAEKGLLTG